MLGDDVAVIETPLVVEEAAPLATVPPGRNIAIVGYTSTRGQAPFDDPSYEVWACNNLHKFIPDKWDRLYDLHPNDEIVKDTEHEAFLRKCRKPVFVWEPRAEWPASVAFPKDDCTAAFGRYFTNSISWMTAHAIMEISAAAVPWAETQVAALLVDNPGLEPFKPMMMQTAVLTFYSESTIAIYGVDMAQGTEYAAQRPSCEYFLGLARGMGIQTFIPAASDLLKNLALYGAEDDAPIRAKMDMREQELTERMGQMQAQQQELFAHLNQMQGALEDTRYWKGVWLNPHANRDGSAKQDETTAAQAAQSDGAGVVSKMTEVG